MYIFNSGNRSCLVKMFPECRFPRTMRQDSKRHHYFCTESELQFVNFFYSVGAIWTFALIFLGALVVNEYSLLKNIVTTFLALVGMAFIAFIGILGVNLFTAMFGFIRTIANEIIYRM